jgi:hypothetical protein
VSAFKDQRETLAQGQATSVDVEESDVAGKFDGDKPEALLTKVRLSKCSALPQSRSLLKPFRNKAPMEGADATVLHRTEQVPCPSTTLLGLD